MQNKIKTGLLFLILSCWSLSNASAASLLGIYAGASVGNAETDGGLDDTTTKIYAGYRIFGPLAVEVSQIDFGTVSTISSDSTSIDAVAYLPLPVVDIFAKAGVHSWNTDIGGSTQESGTSTKFGVGVEFNLIANLDLRVEWEKYTDVSDLFTTDLTVISAGVNIAF